MFMETKEAIDTAEISQNTITERFGIHLMVDGYGAPSELLGDKVKLKALLEELPGIMKMHTISDPFVVEVGPQNKKDPGGISGFVLIAESHISFHTFPARGFVTIDVYTCQDTIDSEGFIKLFKDKFKLKEVETHIQPRGLRYPKHDIH
jgi:S-adenosylmethionine decarboxylase